MALGPFPQVAPQMTVYPHTAQTDPQRGQQAQIGEVPESVSVGPSHPPPLGPRGSCQCSSTQLRGHVASPWINLASGKPLEDS